MQTLQLVLQIFILSLFAFLIIKDAKRVSELEKNLQTMISSTNKVVGGIEESITELVELLTEDVDETISVTEAFQTLPKKVQDKAINDAKKKIAKQQVELNSFYKQLTSSGMNSMSIEEATEVYMEQYIADKKSKKTAKGSKSKAK